MTGEDSGWEGGGWEKALSSSLINGMELGWDPLEWRENSTRKKIKLDPLPPREPIRGVWDREKGGRMVEGNLEGDCSNWERNEETRSLAK